VVWKPVPDSPTNGIGRSQSDDNVSAYTVNAKSGALTPVAGSPFAAATKPTGLAAGSDYLYVTNEGSNNVSAYSINTTSGALKQVAGSPFGAGTGPSGVAIIERTQDAIFAYVTNSGSNNVSAYTVNAKSGALTQVKGSPFTAGTEPYGIDGGPDGVCGSGK